MMLTFRNIWRCQRQTTTIILQNQVEFLRLRNNYYHEEPVPVAWEKPEIGWTKLNFDGSSKGRAGKARIGGALRNHKAEFLLGHAKSIGKASSTIAELTAIRRGLELVLENGWSHNVWLEGDAKKWWRLLCKEEKVKCGEVQKHVSHINSIIPELNSCVFSHVYREANRTADKVAQLGHRFQKPQVWWDNPPDEVLPYLVEDA